MEGIEDIEMKGIILHGGHGTRLLPLTCTSPKQLLPIANKPMSSYALDDLLEAGIKDIAFLVGDLFPGLVRKYYGDGRRYGAKFTYIYQDKPLGIAHAIQCCKRFIGNDNKFVVYLGDNVLSSGIKDHVSRFLKSNYDAIVLLYKVRDSSRFGIATVRERHIQQIVEKPRNSSSGLAVIGVYFLNSKIFQIIKDIKPSWRGELEITDALQALIGSGGKVGYENLQGWWKDTGTPEDILDTNRLLLDNSLNTKIYGRVESRLSLRGRVIIGKNTKISKGSIVRGPVILGENSYIGSSVYVGPFTSIGNNVHIKRGKIEKSIIMDNCIIDTPTKISDSIVANNSRISTISSGSAPSRRNRFLLGERCEVFI